MIRINARTLVNSARHPLLTLSLATLLAACGGDDEDGNNNGPNGGNPSLTTLRTGTLVGDGAGGAPDATGGVSFGRDASGTLFVTLGNDFAQEAGPGDTQLILARTGANVQVQRDADPDSVSVSLGTVPNGFAGAQSFAVPASVNIEGFDYLIVWCPTAGVNFGAARLDSRTPDEVVIRSSTLEGDGAGRAPDATGSVQIVRNTDGRLLVRLGDDFAQEAGPGDTQLILARSRDNVQAQRDADPSNASPALGTIPNGGSGAREFDIPSAVDLDDFDYVIVWCPTAGVNFGAAELPLRAEILAGDGAGGTPDASGGVSLIRDLNGDLVVQLADAFMQEAGPGDTQLILARTADNVQAQRDGDPNATSASLGTIPNGGSGARAFAVPQDVDVDLYDYAIVWCPTAGVNFG